MPADDFGALIGEQVAYLNTLVIATAERIVADDPDAVIVFLSDHGARAEGLSSEWFASFFAARTPGHEGLFPEDAAATTTLAILLNAYLDVGAVVPDPNAQFANMGSTLQLEAWPLDGMTR